MQDIGIGIDIYLTSGARAKLGGTFLAADRVGLPVEIFVFPGESGVSNMPFGIQETMNGAGNRIACVYDQIMAHHATHRPGRIAVIVSIENSVLRYTTNLGLYDVAGIIVQPLGEAPTSVYSEAVVVPTEIALKVLASKGTLTVGQLMCEKHPGIDPQDWQALYDPKGRSRERIIADALAPIFRALKTRLQNEGKLAVDLAGDADDVHVADADGLKVRIPVKINEKTGLPMAFFDLYSPLGLLANKILGQKLATKVPGNVDAIVIPEGKGTFLAGEVAEALGLRPVVLRKKDRGYYKIAHTVSYRSVTTNGPEQSLHITDEEAAAVAHKHVAIVDDVVSTGGTMKALKELLLVAGALSVVVIAVFTEEVRREDVLSLGHLPFPVPAADAPAPA